MTLADRIKLHEGLRLKPYKCTAGKTTIGYGRNIQDIGITKEEAELLLANDLRRVIQKVNTALPWVDRLNEARRGVLYEMCFQLGLAGLLRFKQTLNHVKNGEYEKASREMLNSRWATQAPSRAKTLAEVMRNG